MATTTSGVIIPNKSTIAEEEITVPFERPEDRTSRTTSDERDDPYDDRDTEDGASVGFKSPMSPPAGLSGLNALSNIGNRPKERSRDSDEDPGTARSGDSDYYYNRGAASPARNGSFKGRQSNTIDEEKIRREYELKIATMQSRINSLEGDVVDASSRKSESDDLVRKLQNELEQLRNVSDM